MDKPDQMTETVTVSYGRQYSGIDGRSTGFTLDYVSKAQDIVRIGNFVFVHRANQTLLAAKLSQAKPRYSMLHMLVARSLTVLEAIVTRTLGLLSTCEDN
jgi:hypothetical protein